MRIAAGAVLFDAVRRAGEGPLMEEPEVRRGRREAGERDRVAVPEQARAAPGDRCHRREAAGPHTHVEEVRLGGGPRVAVRVGLVDANQAVGVEDRNRPQHDRIHHAEHRRGRARAEGQGGDGDDGEHRRIPHPAQGVADVHREHRRLSGWRSDVGQQTLFRLTQRIPGVAATS